MCLQCSCCHFRCERYLLFSLKRSHSLGFPDLININYMSLHQNKQPLLPLLQLPDEVLCYSWSPLASESVFSHIHSQCIGWLWRQREHWSNVNAVVYDWLDNLSKNWSSHHPFESTNVMLFFQRDLSVLDRLILRYFILTSEGVKGRMISKVAGYWTEIN